MYQFERTVRPDDNLKGSFTKIASTLDEVEPLGDKQEDTFKVYNEFDDHLEKVNGPKVVNESQHLHSLINTTVGIDSL